MIQIILLSLVAISGISCVIESEARAHPLNGYVLQDASGQVVGNSGVRIGPLDFGLTNHEMLVKYGLPEPLIRNFTTYLGLTGAPAVEALKKKPLTLTQDELTLIENKFVQYWKPRFLKLSPAIRSSPLFVKAATLLEAKNYVEFLKQIDQFSGQIKPIESSQPHTLNK